MKTAEHGATELTEEGLSDAAAAVTAANAIETPTNASVVLHHLMMVSLASGSITHVVNGAGGSVGNGTMTSFFPN